MAEWDRSGDRSGVSNDQYLQELVFSSPWPSLAQAHSMAPSCWRH